VVRWLGASCLARVVVRWHNDLTNALANRSLALRVDVDLN
jgi:hypothetical protein